MAEELQQIESEPSSIDETEIVIKDYIMGSGKTTGQIERINKRTWKDRLNNPLIVIVPLISEIERYAGNKDKGIEPGCPQENFCEPESHYDTVDSKYCNKKESLLRLLADGRSIVTTHALFALFTPEIEAEIQRQNYEIIIDEETCTFIPLAIKRDVWIEINKLEYLYIDNTNKVTWIGPRGDDYDGKFLEVRDKILNGNVYMFEAGLLFIIQTPISFFKLVKKYTILTYMFECSDMATYFKMHGIKYQVDKQTIEEEMVLRKKYKELIEFIPAPRSIKREADKRNTNFSYNYWTSRKPEELKKIRQTLGSYFNSHGVLPSDFLYAVPKSISSPETDKDKKGKHVQIRGYKGCFIPYNSKATNKYKDKTVMLYMQNVYENINIQKYLTFSGFKKSKEDNDNYSLSVMLQCIFRTAIRENGNIKLMILSNRMRKLLDDWLNLPTNSTNI